RARRAPRRRPRPPRRHRALGGGRDPVPGERGRRARPAAHPARRPGRRPLERARRAPRWAARPRGRVARGHRAPGGVGGGGRRRPPGRPRARHAGRSRAAHPDAPAGGRAPVRRGRRRRRAGAEPRGGERRVDPARRARCAGREPRVGGAGAGAALDRAEPRRGRLHGLGDDRAHPAPAPRPPL
ncbi:MAG: hypothetical protein AVDCRST_MAG11-2755, partial [uncultured Gemmatimonadaceae bacterium]